MGKVRKELASWGPKWGNTMWTRHWGVWWLQWGFIRRTRRQMEAWRGTRRGSSPWWSRIIIPYCTIRWGWWGWRWWEMWRQRRIRPWRDMLRWLMGWHWWYWQRSCRWIYIYNWRSSAPWTNLMTWLCSGSFFLFIWVRQCQIYNLHFWLLSWWWCAWWRIWGCIWKIINCIYKNLPSE